MNLKAKINKLLFALQQMGFIYQIKTIKIYSDNKNKYFTKYELYIRMVVKVENKKTGEIEEKNKYIKMLDTFDEVEIIKYLVNDLNDYRKEMDADGYTSKYDSKDDEIL